MIISTEVHIRFEDGEQFKWPVRWNGKDRQMMVHSVFCRYDNHGDLYWGVQISGTLILLNGKLSVSDEGRWATTYIRDESELPEQVRNALEERKARGR